MKLKCEAHDRRAVVIPLRNHPDILITVHRQDGGRCTGPLVKIGPTVIHEDSFHDMEYVHHCTSYKPL